MPELIHGCGKRVRFPSGTEGRRGRCPHCGESVLVPDDAQARQPRIHLDPPPLWSEYLAYMRGESPPPRPVVMPRKLMLAAEADEKWERQAQVRPSKFHCPSCKVRINIDQVVCTGCGVDFRSGKQLGGTARLNDKAMEYLEQVPWLAEARQALEEAGGDEDDKAAARARLAAKAPRPRPKR